MKIGFTSIKKLQDFIETTNHLKKEITRKVIIRINSVMSSVLPLIVKLVNNKLESQLDSQFKLKEN